jgi:glucose/arabinose dehydrogenase
MEGLMESWVMNLSGAAVPSPNLIVLLRDADGDGVAETRSVFLQKLNSPFGMTLIGDKLYVADTDALLRFDYREGATEIKDSGAKVADLPAGRINSHWTKSLVASTDGTRLYVSVSAPTAMPARAGLSRTKVARGYSRSIRRLEETSREQAEAGERDGRPSREQSDQHGQPAAKLGQDHKREKSAGHARRIHMLDRPGIAENLVSARLNENDRKQDSADQLQIRRRLVHLSHPCLDQGI